MTTCEITRYDASCTEAPFTSTKIDECEIELGDEYDDYLGRELYTKLYNGVKLKGYRMKCFTKTSAGIYEIMVE